uniref:Radical S-adenosyl methionine domain containing 2 n=1 Tax=Hucho hucho TaxID=62062 RepID=A0A4W5KRN7_9TELE
TLFSTQVVFVQMFLQLCISYCRNSKQCQLYFVLPIEEAKRGLQLLKESGLEKMYVSVAEPFIHDRGDFLGKLVQYCKHDLQLPSVSIVSNGSMIREKWFQTYGKMVFIFISVLKENMYKVAFKINSVINTFNVDEDMRENITKLNPVRWKVFQCLLIDGENAGENSLREAERFVISDQQFQDFLERHSSISCLVPESNQKIRDSYLILDKYLSPFYSSMRFLGCREGRKDPSKSVLDVGVEEAIQFSGFDEKMFLKRGGKYLWRKADMRLEW